METKCRSDDWLVHCALGLVIKRRVIKTINRTGDGVCLHEESHWRCAHILNWVFCWRGIAGEEREHGMQSVFQSDAGVRYSIANHSFDGNQRSTHNSVSSLLNRCCSSLSARWMIKQRNSTLQLALGKSMLCSWICCIYVYCWVSMRCSLLKLLYNQLYLWNGVHSAHSRVSSSLKCEYAAGDLLPSIWSFNLTRVAILRSEAA